MIMGKQAKVLYKEALEMSQLKKADAEKGLSGHAKKKRNWLNSSAAARSRGVKSYAKDANKKTRKIMASEFAH